MGENRTIYLDDESLNYIDKLEGKGTLINQLIKDYFSQDEEILKLKLEKLDNDRKIIIQQLDNKQTEKARRLIAEQQMNRLSSESSEKRQLKEKLLEIYKEEKITDEEYQNCFNINGLILTKAKEMIEKVNNV